MFLNFSSGEFQPVLDADYIDYTSLLLAQIPLLMHTLRLHVKHSFSAIFKYVKNTVGLYLLENCLNSMQDFKRTDCRHYLL